MTITSDYLSSVTANFRWSTVIGLLLQEMSARLGCVTGKTLAEVAKANYTPFQSMVLYINVSHAFAGVVCICIFANGGPLQR